MIRINGCNPQMLVVLLVSCFVLGFGNKSIRPIENQVLFTDWIKITEHNGETVIYNSCDMGNLILSLSRNHQKNYLKLHGEQEDVDFEILRIIQENDTTHVQVIELNSGFKQSFKFNWIDKSKGLGRWRTQFMTGFKSDINFVNKANKNKFRIMNQPCRDCWGDACDE